MTDPKADLRRYIRRSGTALVWKLDGLSEYDVRRPMTRTGTNLLGLVKHVAMTEAGYLGDCMGRPFPDPPAFFEEDAEPNADMWATPDESRADILALYERVVAHTDATIEALDLDAPGEVPWWPPERRAVTLQLLMVHTLSDMERHAGHADILREVIDGRAGLVAGNENLPDGDEAWWSAYHDRLEAAAQQFVES